MTSFLINILLTGKLNDEILLQIDRSIWRLCYIWCRVHPRTPRNVCRTFAQDCLGRSVCVRRSPGSISANLPLIHDAGFGPGILSKGEPIMTLRIASQKRQADKPASTVMRKGSIRRRRAVGDWWSASFANTLFIPAIRLWILKMNTKRLQIGNSTVDR